MYNHISIASSLFGSVYLFSISLTLLNKALLTNEKIPNEIFIANGLTMLVTGSVIMYNFSLLNMSLFNLPQCK